MMKRLAEINLVKGDYDAARKYLRILQKTFVWSRWANRAFDALGRKASSYDKALLQQYIDKRPYLNTRDTLRLNDNCHTIMSELLESNPNNNIAVNYMLCSDLLLEGYGNLQARLRCLLSQAAECNLREAIPGGTCHLSGRNKGSACRMGKVYQEAGCIAEIQAV